MGMDGLTYETACNLTESLMPRAGTLGNFYVTSLGADIDTATFTVLKNNTPCGSPATVSCSITAGGTCNDTTNTCAFTAGEYICIEVTGVTNGQKVRWTATYE
jgi:hypothetical protein